MMLLLCVFFFFFFFWAIRFDSSFLHCIASMLLYMLLGIFRYDVSFLASIITGLGLKAFGFF